MTSSIELVLLKCLRCGAKLPAEEEDVAWTCAQCEQGLLLTETGLAPLTVNWAAARPGATDVRWQPVWVFTGTVNFSQRESYGWLSADASAPDPFWNSPRRFYLPAFPLALEDMEKLGATLTRAQTVFKPGPSAGPLKNCTLHPDDAKQAAEFIVLTIEAERKDKIRAIKFQLSLSQPELWVLPFAGQGVSLALA